jgi:hypothetical protein
MDAAAYKLLRRAGCLLIGIGVVGFVLSLLMYFISGLPLMRDTTYSYLTWSPSGDRLAFVKSQESSGYAIYVVDANGKHRTKVFDKFCDLFGEGCYDGVTYLRWSEDGQTLYFGNVGYPSGDWAVSLHDKSYRQISSNEVSVQSDLLSLHCPTLCDETKLKEIRQLNSTGMLVAQVVLSIASDGRTIEQLQICELSTGKRIFRENEIVDLLPFARFTGLLSCGIGASGILLLILLVVLINPSRSATPATPTVRPESRR